MEWSDEYSIGLDKIDAQHALLFEYVSEMKHALKDEEIKNSVFRDIIPKVIDYMKESISST